MSSASGHTFPKCRHRGVSWVTCSRAKSALCSDNGEGMSWLLQEQQADRVIWSFSRRFYSSKFLKCLNYTNWLQRTSNIFSSCCFEMNLLKILCIQNYKCRYLLLAVCLQIKALQIKAWRLSVLHNCFSLISDGVCMVDRSPREGEVVRPPSAFGLYEMESLGYHAQHKSAFTSPSVVNKIIHHF